MADLTLSGTYEIEGATPDDFRRGTAHAAFDAIINLTANDDGGGDSNISFTAVGHYANLRLDGAVSVTATDLTSTPAINRTWSGYRIHSVKKLLVGPRTEIEARRFIDLRALAGDVLDHLRDGALTQTLSGLYPLQTRWDGIIRPIGAVPNTPHIWAHIADEIERGGDPDWGRLKSGLARFGLEVWILDSLADAPAGTIRLTAAGTPCAVVPLNYRALVPQPNDPQGNPQPSLPKSLPVSGADADAGTVISYADAADERLTRRIRYSVPVERAGAEKAQEIATAGEPVTRAIYEGGTTGEAIILKKAFDRPHYGAVALEGERARRYLTNETLELRALLGLGLRIRDGIQIPASDVVDADGEWVVTKLTHTIGASVGTSMTLRRYRPLTAAEVYANSPSPFNGASGWDEINKLPSAPGLELLAYNPAQGTIQRLPNQEAAIQANGGGSFTVGIIDAAPSDPQVETTLASVSQGANLINNARANGRGAAIPFVDGGAGTVYTIRCTFENEWGESPPAEIQVQTASGQKPSTSILQMRPKIIRQQLEWLPDDLFAAYNELLTPLLPAANSNNHRHAGSAINVLGLSLESDNAASLTSSIAASLIPLGLAASVGGIVVAGATVGGILGVLSVGGLSMSIGGFVIASSQAAGFAVSAIGLGAAASATVIGAVIVALGAVVLGAYFALESAENNGMELLIYADGHGYEVTDVKVQVNFRTSPTADFGGWQELGSGGSWPPDSGVARTELASNDSGTIKQFFQFHPITSGGGAFDPDGNQYVYRACAITSQNENDADADLDWVQSPIIRGEDIDKLWVEVYDNPSGDGLAVRRYDDARPSYP